MDSKPAEKVPPVKDVGGVWTVMGDRSYKIPPLNFRQLREFQPKIEAMRDIKGRLPSAAELTTVAELVTAALSRNYPETKQSDVIEFLDVGNFRGVFDAIMGTSGVQRVGPGE